MRNKSRIESVLASTDRVHVPPLEWHLPSGRFSQIVRPVALVVFRPWVPMARLEEVAPMAAMVAGAAPAAHDAAEHSSRTVTFHRHPPRSYAPEMARTNRPLPTSLENPASAAPSTSPAAPKAGTGREGLLSGAVVASLCASLFTVFPPLAAMGQQPAMQAGGSGASADAADGGGFAGLRWRNIGPFRGGSSNASTGVIGQPHTFYFGGVGSGVWKTTDSGETWTNVSDDTFQTASVGAIEVAASDPNVVYVGMGEHAVRGVMTSHGDGVYRSLDAGRSWQKLGLEPTRHISAIRVHPRDPQLVYVAAQGAAHGRNPERGIYRSRDGGESWEHVLFVSQSARAAALSMVPRPPRSTHAAFWDHVRLPWQVRSGGPGSGIWKSVDGGDSWRRLGETVEKGLPALKGKIGVAAASPSRVYALVEADPGGGLYRSDDGGETWRLVNDDWGLRARAWYYIKVYADPSDENVVWITNARMYRSLDGGGSFEAVATPHGDNHHLWIDPDDSSRLINSNDGGANVSHDGGRSWSTQQNQPTAQFYRVNVDDQFPYHVYGGQQDNSAIGIVNRSPGGVSWSDFYSVAGCESAWAAFDPEDPRYVYGGCYMGILEEWDRVTGSSRDAMAYPVMPAALPSRELRYRFNWSAPVITSPFDRSVIYHAANVVLKSTDRAVTWNEISPDLTRDDDEKQGPGGGPITNEGAGGEIYGTLYTMAASTLAEGQLWVGSDDGRVHLTRDDGATWVDVTPPGIGEALINAVEASPHDPARAYVAVTRYKFNDFRPMALRTDDFGASWTSIAGGLRSDSWVRVVREDPVRPGLLYLGSEHGVQVSFDDGGSWRPLMNGFPVAAITDLIVQRRDNDLVAATAGRSFWILDDLSPLQQHVPGGGGDRRSSDEQVIRLVDPEPGVRTPSGGFRLPADRVGANPPGPVTFDFFLPELADEAEVALEVRSGGGEVVRRFVGKVDRGGRARPPAAAADETTGEASEVAAASTGELADDVSPQRDEEKEPMEQALEAQSGEFVRRAGHHRVAWDLRHRPLLGVPGLYVFGSLQGRPVVPDAYDVVLTVDADGEGPEEPSEHRTTIDVLADPRLDATAEGYAEQDALARRVAETTEAAHRAVLELREVRKQVERWGRVFADSPVRADGSEASSGEQEGNSSLAERARALSEALTAIEDRLIQKRVVDGQTVINFPMRLNQFLIYLHAAVADAPGIVNAGSRQRYADLSAQWEAVLADLEAIYSGPVREFNDAVREAQPAPVRLPPPAGR